MRLNFDVFGASFEGSYLSGIEKSTNYLISEVLVPPFPISYRLSLMKGADPVISKVFSDIWCRETRYRLRSQIIIRSTCTLSLVKSCTFDVEPDNNPTVLI